MNLLWTADILSEPPEASGVKQKRVIRQCIELASRNLPIGEPLNRMETAFPSKWKLNGKTELFNWD